jgi:hypothetical protein
VLLPSVVTFALILFLKPMGFSGIEFSERALIALVISVLVGLSIFLVVKALRFYLPNYMNEDQWTLGKEVLLWLIVLFIIVCSISVVFMSVIIYQYESQVALNSKMFFHVFLNTVYITMGISIIPIIILILFEQHNHQKKQYKEARQFSDLLQEQLKSVKKPDPISEKILFTSENNEVELQVNPQDVIFIQSEGNYVEIYYLNAGSMHKKLIRHRLKLIEEQLPETLFFRCHNRYIVNTKRITNVTGNARGLYLDLENTAEVIPVSRSRVKAFKAVFEK